MDRLTLRRVSQPALEPVSLTEAKLHSRIDINDDDARITSSIVAARSYCEEHCRRQFINASWRLSLDWFPSSWNYVGAFSRPAFDGTDIILPRPQVSAITSITYYDGSGALQTLAPSTYVLSADDEPARIALSPGSTWPATQTARINAAQITYVSGYGADGSFVPQPIKQAILMLVGHWNEQREAVFTGSITKEVEFAVSSLLSPFTVMEQW